MNANFTAAKMDDSNDQPARPREPVKTGMLSTGSAARRPSTSRWTKFKRADSETRTVCRAPAIPTKRANINHYGSPDLPGGPGYGNGTGGANGARGTVASTGFRNGTAKSAFWLRPLARHCSDRWLWRWQRSSHRDSRARRGPQLQP